MGGVPLTFAILSVKAVGGDRAVLIGSVPSGEYSGDYECAADAGGYHWSFHGSVFDQLAEGTEQVRVWIRSEGAPDVRRSG